MLKTELEKEVRELRQKLREERDNVSSLRRVVDATDKEIKELRDEYMTVLKNLSALNFRCTEQYIDNDGLVQTREIVPVIDSKSIGWRGY